MTKDTKRIEEIRARLTAADPEGLAAELLAMLDRAIEEDESRARANAPDPVAPGVPVSLRFQLHMFATSYAGTRTRADEERAIDAMMAKIGETMRAPAVDVAHTADLVRLHDERTVDTNRAVLALCDALGAREVIGAPTLDAIRNLVGLRVYANGEEGGPVEWIPKGECPL